MYMYGCRVDWSIIRSDRFPDNVYRLVLYSYRHSCQLQTKITVSILVYIRVGVSRALTFIFIENGTMGIDY
jgi:hypothetical protein